MNAEKQTDGSVKIFINKELWGHYGNENKALAEIKSKTGQDFKTIDDFNAAASGKTDTPVTAAPVTFEVTAQKATSYKTALQQIKAIVDNTGQIANGDARFAIGEILSGLEL